MLLSIPFTWDFSMHRLALETAKAVLEVFQFPLLGIFPCIRRLFWLRLSITAVLIWFEICILDYYWNVIQFIKIIGWNSFDGRPDCTFCPTLSISSCSINSYLLPEKWASARSWEAGTGINHRWSPILMMSSCRCMKWAPSSVPQIATYIWDISKGSTFRQAHGWLLANYFTG